jgi:hypothetical protein
MLIERKWGGGFTSDDSNGYRFSLSLLIPAQRSAEPGEAA